MEFLSPSKAEVVITPVGTMRLWVPAPGVLVSVVSGVLLDKAAAAYESAARRVIAEHGRFLGFADWEAMTDYESQARVRLTNLVRSFGRGFEGGHFIVQSKLIALGVQTAGILIPGLVVHRSRVPFEAALRNVMRTRQIRAS